MLPSLPLLRCYDGVITAGGFVMTNIMSGGRDILAQIIFFRCKVVPKQRPGNILIKKSTYVISMIIGQSNSKNTRFQ